IEKLPSTVTIWPFTRIVSAGAAAALVLLNGDDGDDGDDGDNGKPQRSRGTETKQRTPMILLLRSVSVAPFLCVIRLPPSPLLPDIARPRRRGAHRRRQRANAGDLDRHRVPRFQELGRLAAGADAIGRAA